MSPSRTVSVPKDVLQSLLAEHLRRSRWSGLEGRVLLLRRSVRHRELRTSGHGPEGHGPLEREWLRFSAGSTTAWYRVVMDASKIWSAGELEKMSPNERQSIVRAGFETDLSKVSPELLERTQRRIKVHISANQVATTPER